VPRGDPVNGVGIVRYRDAVPGQLLTESYRPRTSGWRRRGQGGDALLQFFGPADQRLPDPLAPLRVERREDLAAAGVENGETIAANAGLPHALPDRIEGADPAHRQAEAGAEPARGGNADPQPGEGAGTEPDGEPVDPLPAARRGGAALDLPQQGGRMRGTPLGRGPQQRLLQNLAVAPGAGGGVGGRGIEADENQRSAASSS
jgi:hypothetical protein